MDGAVGEDVVQALRKDFGNRVRFDEPLSRHTSFRIGGPADAWVEASAAQEIVALLNTARQSGLRLTVLGGGTNVLVSDRGVRGIVLRLGAGFRQFEWGASEGGQLVRAGAAARLTGLVEAAAERGLTGLEFAEGIPGSIGGNVRMNAGAFGGEIGDVLEAVIGVDPEHGERRLLRSELDIRYRSIDLPEGFIVTHVEMALRRDDPAAVRERMAAVRKRRSARQPIGKPNAGSVFKNPKGQFAGRLIESVGMKGRRVGDAMVSEQHANFIVNMGGARAVDVKRLIDDIADAVWRERAVRLVPEIKLVGDWEASG